MCKLAGVSRSGYYNWVSKKPFREDKDIKDALDFKMIKEAYDYKSWKKGARQIKYRIYKDYGIVMNLKKIRRLMKKYNLICPIRKINPIKAMIKANQANRTYSNIVDRNFNQGKSKLVLLTDITYLTYGSGKRAYLSSIKDATTKMILAHQVSTSLDLEFVIKTVNFLIENYKAELDDNVVIHSDYAEEKTMPENLITSCILIIRIQFFGIVFRVSQARRLLSLYQRSSTAFRHRQLWEQTC